MNSRDKHFLRIFFIVALLIITTQICRMISYHLHPGIAASTIDLAYYVIHVGLLTVWEISVQQRIINSKVRFYLVTTALLMIFWLTIRTCKFTFLPEYDDLRRFCWYCYYIAMILIPVMGVFIVDYIGKSENYISSRKTYFLYIPAFFLIGGVLTNDLHNLAFTFPEGIYYYDTVYNYSILYYLAMAWIILLGLYFVIMLLYKNYIPGTRSIQWLPFGVFVLAVSFWIFYAINHPDLDLTAISCAFIIILLESIIQSDLIQSCSNYNKLFNHSTIAAQIVDEDYQIRYISESASLLGTEMMRKAEKKPLHIDGIRLHSAAITGGHVLWQEDVSQLLNLRCELNEVRTQLQENNELLKAEVDLKERRVQVKEQNRLYDKISREIDDPLRKIDDLLMECSQDPKHIQENLQKICIIGAYAKRRGNLILLEDEKELISAKELEYCIRESLDQLRLSSAVTSMDSSCSGQISIDDAMMVYDVFEEIVEALFSDIVAMLIHFTCDDHKLHLRMQLGLTAEIPIPRFTEPEQFDITVLCQDEDITFDLYLPKGGERS